MIEVSRLTLLLLVECLFGLTLLSGFLLGSQMLKKARIRKAAQHLVERIQNDKAARTERLKKRLVEAYQMEGENLEQGVQDLSQVEMRLYQNIINSYLKRDILAFQQTDVDVENLVRAYQELAAPSSNNMATEVGVDVVDNEEIEQLKSENARLSEELRVTMDTMGRMLNEYSFMFAGGAAPNTSSSLEQDGLAPDVVSDSTETSDEVTEQSDSGVKLTENEIDVSPESDIQDDMEQLAAGEEAFDTSLSESPSNGKISNSMTLEADTEQDPSESGVSDLNQTEGDDSLMDDLQQLDIEIPDAGEVKVEGQPDPGSLEEDWAKLLEEDAEVHAAKSQGEATEAEKKLDGV